MAHSSITSIVLAEATLQWLQSSLCQCVQYIHRQEGWSSLPHSCGPMETRRVGKPVQRGWGKEGGSGLVVVQAQQWWHTLNSDPPS